MKLNAAVVAAGLMLVVALPAAAPASAEQNCEPATTRLTQVSAEAVDGTIYATPLGGGEQLRLRADLEAYHHSSGFGAPAPEAVTEWDQTLDQVAEPVDSSDPNWYGKAKARVFAPRTLNTIAERLPDGALQVSYEPGERPADWCAITSIEPVAP
ncbi:hypothetical protein [Mycolicibacterium brumae]|uniref:Uncharacterized protein n=1 Tax=Mycolicibacterium brumae TaxID=85968 RepID=A0A2G5PDT8_9MYCO|nr:hypothetical protein [Mycolicibacterium brumae]MCV7192856.1 hypothetical protein [Mycolicibacterium brumae]PIB76477.1 hypothetical protein CQY22_004960 [Mycolicibacterium brumae]RWA23446.1 hypothetical protein MBRU_01090 [Mycolicibacterium brumae DSM 44177]UWW08624.1 hypothetical protein L2Z93_001687 [Mycolicibacterium brumae]